MSKLFKPAVIIFVALGPIAALGPAHASPDCDGAYRGMLERIERKKAHLSAEAQVSLNRTALRVYEACRTGHLENPGMLFERLDRTSY
jgi:hypothetical protein